MGLVIQQQSRGWPYIKYMEFLKEHYQALLIALISIYLAAEKIFSGSYKLKNTIIADDKIRIDQLTGQRDRCDEKAREMEKENSALLATIDQKNIQMVAMKEQIAFQNPDITALIKQGFEINQKVIEFMEMNIEMMEKMNTKMDYQTEMLEKGAERNKKIDIATEKHIGDPLRKT